MKNIPQILLFSSSFENMANTLDEIDIKRECEKIKRLLKFFSHKETSTYEPDALLWKYHTKSLSTLYYCYTKHLKCPEIMIPHFLIHPHYARLLYTSTRLCMLQRKPKYKKFWPKNWKHLQKQEFPEIPFNPHPISKKSFSINRIWMKKFRNIYPEIQNLLTLDMQYD